MARGGADMAGGFPSVVMAPINRKRFQFLKEFLREAKMIGLLGNGRNLRLSTIFGTAPSRYVARRVSLRIIYGRIGHSPSPGTVIADE